jgi:cytochrome P450
MTASAVTPPASPRFDPKLSLYHLLDPQVLADPYPLYHRLRNEAPVLWDPYLYAWVVTRYADIVTVLHQFSAKCAPTPEHLAAMGMPELAPVAQVMMRQMLFMDAPAHTRLRGLASMAFTPARVEVLRSHIQEIVDNLIDPVVDAGRMDVIADLAAPLPAIVASELLGVPTSDHPRLKQWSEDFAEVLGNFQHNPNRASRTLKCVEEMSAYFRDAIRRCRTQPREGLVHSLVTAEIDGDRLTEDEIIANCIVTMVGAQETTTNLIGNGMLTLLRNPDQLQRLKDDRNLIPSAVEELLRYESPSQHTTRLATEDTELGGKKIRKGQAVIVVMGAGNRDPERFADPDRLDVCRRDNRHLAFGWASHFCFGAALARIEGHIAFDTIVNRLPELALQPGPLVWRENLGLRGLSSLPVTFGKGLPASTTKPSIKQSESVCPFH